MRGSETVRIEDLTGGINQLDYPSEIDNKQAQDITNFNFDGNKLVSSKGLEQEVSGNFPIQGIKIDNEDIWDLRNNVIYKNGQEIISKKGARLRVKGLTYFYKEAQKSTNGNTYTFTSKTVEYFPDGIKYFININGTDYYGEGNNIDSIHLDLSEKLLSAGFNVIEASGYLYITSENAITITIPGYTNTVVFLQNIIQNNFPWDNTYVKGFYYNIDGNKGFYYTNKQFSDFSSASDFDVFIRDGFYDELVQINPDVVKTFLSAGFNEDGQLTIYGDVQTSSGYAGIIIPGDTTISFEEKVPGATNSYIGTYGNDFFTNVTSIVLGGTTTVDFSSEGITDINGLLTWLNNNGYSNSISLPNSFHNYDGGFYRPAIYYINDNFEAVSVDYNGNPDIRELTISLQADLVYDSFIISENIFEFKSLDLELNGLGIVDLTIANNGTLLTSRDDGGAFYYGEDLLIDLGVDAVGEPKVGTIYNGKIVLGGYEGNDNIVFSQTATPTSPFDLLNFNEYSAGGQSVSGGDKGVITGFKVSENGLYVFKDNSIWYSNSEKDNPASNSFNFIFNKITSSGAYSQSVITDVGQDVFYLDWKERAVRRLSYEQNLTTLRDTAISREIEPILRELPKDQTLATSNYTYPNYRLYLSDHTGPTITYPNGKTYNTNNLCFTYNVYNKSWTTEEIGNVVVANESIVGLDDNNIYRLEVDNLNKEGYYKSKEYSEGDDFIKKKYSRIDLLGKLIPETGESLTFTISALNNNGEVIKSVSKTVNSEERLKLELHTYFLSTTVTFELSYTGKGRVEVYDLFYEFKPTKI